MVVRVLARFMLALTMYAVCLFGGAGTLRWPQAWIFLLVMSAMSAILMALLWRKSPDLVRERMRGPFQRAQTTWDKVFLALCLPLYFGWLALMGLDAMRMRWSAVPMWLQVLAGVVLLGMSPWFYRVLRANAYAAPVVKIDAERGQTVATTGPYAIMRHPMYAGILVMLPSIALMLGSWFGLLGAALLDMLVIVRTVLEDRLLQKELDGYEAYAHRVRYRLMPGLW